MNACQEAQALTTILQLFPVTVTPLSIVGFYGWRRLRRPWRSLSFVLFVLSTLLLLDLVAVALAYALTVSGTAPPAPHCR